LAGDSSTPSGSCRRGARTGGIARRLAQPPATCWQPYGLAREAASRNATKKDMTSPDAKAALRSDLRARLADVPPGERAAESLAAQAILRGQAVWQKAASVLFYAPLPDELDLWPMLSEALAAGKLAALPRFDQGLNGYRPFIVRNPLTDLSKGRYGIPEPAPHCEAAATNQLDLALVPGVGFDVVGCRLGRGKGFYDRMLAEVSGTKCGIAYDFQVRPAIPAEPHDVCLDCILTPTRWHVVAGHRPVT